MSTLDATLAAIRSAPLATLDDLNKLLNAAHGRISGFGEEFDMANVMDRLADGWIDRQRELIAITAGADWIDERRAA